MFPGLIIAVVILAIVTLVIVLLVLFPFPNEAPPPDAPPSRATHVLMTGFGVVWTLVTLFADVGFADGVIRQFGARNFQTVR